jgi:protein-S-isoprenylcysteine O-methyltransferase Ste14
LLIDVIISNFHQYITLVGCAVIALLLVAFYWMKKAMKRVTWSKL